MNHPIIDNDCNIIKNNQLLSFNSNKPKNNVKTVENEPLFDLNDLDLND